MRVLSDRIGLPLLQKLNLESSRQVSAQVDGSVGKLYVFSYQLSCTVGVHVHVCNTLEWLGSIIFCSFTTIKAHMCTAQYKYYIERKLGVRGPVDEFNDQREESITQLGLSTDEVQWSVM